MSSTWFQSHRFPLGPSLALLLGVSALSLPGATPAKPAPPPKAAPKKTPQSAPAKPSASISRNPYIGAIAIDADTGRVLVEDKADAQGYPASMLKLMGLYLHLEKLKRGELALQDRVQVSARAAKTGGSQVWLAEKEVFSVEDLLFALMIQSANDAAVALAEKAAGSCEAFVALMNEKAKALGMTRTTFQSVHGLPPGAGQQPDRTTARDFAILCRALLSAHPETLRYTSTRVRNFREAIPDKMIIMRTHNHLLADVPGCDGLKTGYFANAGFSVAATAARDGRRVIAIVMGSSDRKVRDARAADLIRQGFAMLAGSSPTSPATVPAGAAAPRPASPPSRSP